MMLVVMELHRFGIDKRLQRVVVVTQRWQLEYALAFRRRRSRGRRDRLAQQRRRAQCDGTGGKSDRTNGGTATGHANGKLYSFLRRMSLNSTVMSAPAWICNAR